MKKRADNLRLTAMLGVMFLLFTARCPISVAQQPTEDKTPATPVEKEPSGKKKPLEVIFFYVRQGDSTLIKTPGGKHILIDGGICKTEWNRFDAAERVIIPYLKEKGIKKLNLVIGTHPDLDHIGGLTTLFKDKEIEIGCYIDPGKSHTTSYYKELLQLVKERGIPYKIGRAGQELKLGDGIKAEIVSPSRLVDDNNECSIVLRLKYGNASFLLTGDAEEEAELGMRSRFGYKLKSVFLKAGHHGSRGSSTSSFLNYVKPKYAVISCGKNNKYGHPHDEALDRLKKAGAKILRTDEMGTFAVRTDGKTMKIIKIKTGEEPR